MQNLNQKYIFARGRYKTKRDQNLTPYGTLKGVCFRGINVMYLTKMLRTNQNLQNLKIYKDI